MNELSDSEEDRSFVRPGERKPDMGLIHRRGEVGKDHKDFLHFTHDLHQHLGVCSDRIKSRLRILNRLYDELNDLSTAFAKELDDTSGGNFICSLAEEIRLARKLIRPYSTTTLRCLRYPPIVGQRGAQTHIDRSLFSVHCGDKGGQLFARESRESNTSTLLSPSSGEVVIFAGVKLWLLSRGRIKPIWHYAETIPGKERLALVQFVQADVPGILVHDAVATYELWEASH